MIQTVHMKTLYLVRHAKSSWKDPRLDDFERPLNKRGRKNAPFMGTVLKKRHVQPDMILSSPANRAAMTARLIAAEIDYPLDDIFYDESLYGMAGDEMVGLVQVIDDGIDELMLVAHNPGLTDLANMLGDAPVSNIPTCGVYCIRFHCATWESFSNKPGKTAFFDYPKKAGN